MPEPSEAARKLKLLWVSCGDKDGLINISQKLHAYLKDKERAAPLARRFRRPHLAGLEERPLPLLPADLPLRQAGQRRPNDDGTSLASGVPVPL